MTVVVACLQDGWLFALAGMMVACVLSGWWFLLSVFRDERDRARRR